MNATKVFTRRVADDDDEGVDDDVSEPELDDDEAGTRTYAKMRSVFHWLAKAIRKSRLRREVFISRQTKSVKSGGAGLPPRMTGAALEHKFVADDVELGTMLKNAEVFRLLMEHELDNPAFGYHGTPGAAGKKLKFRNTVHQFLEDVPALKLIYPVLEKVTRCDWERELVVYLKWALTTFTNSFPVSATTSQVRISRRLASCCR